MNIELVQNRDSALKDALLSIWEESVRATHFFLAEEDICLLRPQVLQGLEAIPLLLCLYDNGHKPWGFMGLEGKKIEMLFLHPACRGRGFGKQCIRYAIEELGASLVDVNEQNQQALAFYEHMGFSIRFRSAQDSSGRPFPILHMGLK